MFVLEMNYLQIKGQLWPIFNDRPCICMLKPYFMAFYRCFNQPSLCKKPLIWGRCSHKSCDQPLFVLCCYGDSSVYGNGHFMMIVAEREREWQRETEREREGKRENWVALYHLCLSDYIILPVFILGALIYCLFSQFSTSSLLANWQ